MAIFVTMGNYQAKNDQVVIAQTGSDNSARAELEHKLEVYGTVTLAIVVIIFSVCVYVIMKKCGKHVKGRIVNDLVSRVEQGRAPVTEPVTAQVPTVATSAIY